jgi:hypothetical protein
VTYLILTFGLLVATCAAAEQPYGLGPPREPRPALGFSAGYSVPLNANAPGSSGAGDLAAQFELPVTGTGSLRFDAGRSRWPTPHPEDWYGHPVTSLTRTTVSLMTARERGGARTFHGVGIGRYRYTMSAAEPVRRLGLAFSGGADTPVSRRMAISAEAQVHLIGLRSARQADVVVAASIALKRRF